MNQKPKLFDTQIFTQVIRCECGESLFEIAEMYKKDISIRCHKCGVTFKVYAEKANEAVAKNLHDRELKLSELLEIRLHSFEDQIGYGQGAALLFETFAESILNAVTESIDSDILEELRELFFRRIKDSGIDKGQELFLLDIERVVSETLRSSGYELLDGEAEIEDE